MRLPLFLLLLALCLASGNGRASTQFEALLGRADALRTGNTDQFLALLGQLDAQVETATPLQRQRLSLLHTYRLARAGDFDAAIAELKLLFEGGEDLALRFRAGAFLANNYAITREFSEGLAYLDRTLSLLPQIKDSEIRHQGLHTAAIIYNQVGQYELGLHYSEQVLSENAHERTRCIAALTRLEALYSLGRLPAQDADFDTAIAQCLAQDEILIAGFVRAYLARKRTADGQAVAAIAELESHLPQIEATRYPRLVAEVHALLADLHVAHGDLARAEHYARSAIEHSSGIPFSLPQVNARKALYDIAARRGDTSAALEHLRGYAQADKAYLDDVKARELAFQLAKHETLQKTQTIELLNQRNEVLQLEQKVASQAAANTRLLLALLLLVLASIAYWAYKIKRVQVSFRRLAETDTLTGISNRHHFTSQAQTALANCARSGEDASLIMFDLDRFKTINDEYGHATGDWVLQEVTAACRAVCSGHALGRLGGEEFAVFLAGADADRAEQTAERCRSAIAAIDTAASGRCFPVSASFGVASARISGYAVETLLAHADQALYRSKHAGRDRVSVFRLPTVAAVITPDAAAVRNSVGFETVAEAALASSRHPG